MFQCPGRRSKNKPTKKPYRNPRFAPAFETFEDRTVPATFTVTTFDDVVSPGGKLSLREAITAANATPAADTIILGKGTYNLTAASSTADCRSTPAI